MTEGTTLHDLIAGMIRHWGPESPDEPGAADRLATTIIEEVLAAKVPLRPVGPATRLARAAERIATILEQEYLDRRGRGAKLPKVGPR